jgi:inorganic pyrophosphatase
MFDKITLSTEFPLKIDVIVEIPRGSHNKYEYDESLGLIRLDRVLHSSVIYPTDYGFVPQTRSEDGDHLDVLVLITDHLFPGCVVTVRPIGMIDMDDDKGKDWKVIAVADTDPRYKEVTSLKDVDQHYLKEIQQFFEVYKQLENKTVTFNGWLDKEKAIEIIKATNLKFLEE